MYILEIKTVLELQSSNYPMADIMHLIYGRQK